MGTLSLVASGGYWGGALGRRPPCENKIIKKFPFYLHLPIIFQFQIYVNINTRYILYTAVVISSRSVDSIGLSPTFSNMWLVDGAMHWVRCACRCHGNVCTILALPSVFFYERTPSESMKDQEWKNSFKDSCFNGVFMSIHTVRISQNSRHS